MDLMARLALCEHLDGTLECAPRWQLGGFHESTGRCKERCPEENERGRNEEHFLTQELRILSLPTSKVRSTLTDIFPRRPLPLASGTGQATQLRCLWKEGQTTDITVVKGRIRRLVVRRRYAPMKMTKRQQWFHKEHWLACSGVAISPLGQHRTFQLAPFLHFCALPPAECVITGAQVLHKFSQLVNASTRRFLTTPRARLKRCCTA